MARSERRLSGEQARQADARVVALADEQDGCVSHEQLRGLGVTSDAIRTRCAHGWLQDEHRGVYRVARPRLGDRGVAMAAHLAAGARSTVSHETAGVLLGLPVESPGVVHLTSPTPIVRPGVRHHRGDPQRHWLGRLPVTTVARTVVDLAPRLTAARLEDVVDAAVRHHELDLDEVRALAKGRRGARRLAMVLPHAAPSRSAMETAFKRLCRRHGLPTPLINAVVVLPSGVELEIDAYFADHAIAVELDSDAHHQTKRDRRADRRKDTRYRTAGLIPRRYDYDDVTRRAPETAHDLRLLMRAVER